MSPIMYGVLELISVVLLSVEEMRREDDQRRNRPSATGPRHGKETECPSQDVIRRNEEKVISTSCTYWQIEGD